MLVVVGPVAGEIVAVVVVATEEGNEGEQAVSSPLYIYIPLFKSLPHTFKKKKVTETTNVIMQKD